MGILGCDALLLLPAQLILNLAPPALPGLKRFSEIDSSAHPLLKLRNCIDQVVGEDFPLLVNLALILPILELLILCDVRILFLRRLKRAGFL